MELFRSERDDGSDVVPRTALAIVVRFLIPRNRRTKSITIVSFFLSRTAVCWVRQRFFVLGPLFTLATTRDAVDPIPADVAAQQSRLKYAIDGDHRRLLQQAPNVGADISRRLPRQETVIKIVRDPHPTCHRSQYPLPRFLVRRPQHDLAIEPTGATQGRVHGVGAIGSSQDHHRAAVSRVLRVDGIHAREQLRHYSLLHSPPPAPGPLAALRRDGIDLVDEYYRGSVVARALEQRAHAHLRLAANAPYELGCRHLVVADVQLPRYGPRQVCLPAPRRAAE